MMHRYLQYIKLVLVSFLMMHGYQSYSQPSLSYSANPNLTTAVFSGYSFSVAGQITGISAYSFTFSLDGTKMYATGSSGEPYANDIFEYSLSTPYDISTAAYVATFDVIFQDTGNSQGIRISDNGSKVFIVGDNSVLEYTLSVPYDITTAVKSFTLDLSLISGFFIGLEFNNDGTRMYIIEGNTAIIYQFNLSSGYDLSTSTSSYTSSLDISGSDLAPSGLIFSLNGLNMYFFGRNSKLIFEYKLSAPFNIVSGIFSESFTPSQAETDVYAIDFNDTYNKIYLFDAYSQKRIYAYNLTNKAFVEALINDGSVEGSIILRIRNDTFTNAGATLASPTHFTINNLPSGLTPSLAVSSDGLTATLSLAGNATNNTDANDIIDLQFTFTNTAFTAGNAVAVVNAIGASSNLGIDFSINTDTKFQTFTLLEETAPATIDVINNNIDIEVAYGTDVTVLVSTFTLSTGATTAVGATAQISGTTVNDFTSPVIYTITAEDGTTSQDWTVTVTINTGLVAHYPFSGDATDASGNGNDGTVNGGATLTTDRFGNANSAYSFDGVDDWISVAHNDDLDFNNTAGDEFSGFAWVNTSVGGYIINKNPGTGGWDPGYRLAITGGQLDLMLEHPTGSPHWYGSLVNDAKWHYIGFTIDADTDLASVYLDGKLDFTADISIVGSTSNTTQLSIGSRNGANLSLGLIDDIRIYNRALSATEIQALYQENGWDINNINAFSLTAQTETAVIDTAAHTVVIEVAYGTDATALVPTFTLSPGATAKVGATNQISGTTANDFTSQVIYTVTAEDGTTTQDWVVTVHQAVVDIDGNSYKTVEIGTQTWMAENLKTINYNDGTAITLVTDNTAWSNLTTEGYCWYNNDEATYGADYGALYNWYAVNTNKLCPTGWHVPTDNQWKTLEMYLGMSQIVADSSDNRGSPVGGKLKESGTTHWNPPNTGATNESGFAGLPGGYRGNGINGNFYSIGYGGYWWSSTQYASTTARNREIWYNYDWVNRVFRNDETGFSIRCLTSSARSDFLTFILPKETLPATIDTVNHTINIQVAYGTSLNALVVTFELSYGAVAYVGSVYQVSGTTANNFTTPVTYTVTAEDGTTTQDWTVTVTIDDGLVAYYPFSGDATDASGNGNNGTLGDGVTTTTYPTLTTDRFGNANSAYSFDGVDDWIYIGDLGYGGLSNHSISTWIKIESVQRNPIINNYSEITNELNYINLYASKSGIPNPIYDQLLAYNHRDNSGVGNDIAYSAEKYQITEWIHVLGVRDVVGDSISLFINGKLSNTSIGLVESDVTNSDLWQIGHLYDTSNPPDAYFIGTIDDIKIYNHALSATEIQTLYQENGWDINNINAFSLAEQVTATVIDTAAHTVNIEVPYGTDLTTLVPNFTLSLGATATISAVTMLSGITANDYTNSVVVTITAADGITTQDWLVTVSVAPNNETDILTFSFSEQTGQARIDTVNHRVDIEVVYGTSLLSLIPTFTLSPGAVAYDIAAVSQVSGTTANDFSTGIVYDITAEDGATTQGWEVWVTVEEDLGPPSIENLTMPTVYASGTASEVLFATIADEFELGFVSINYKLSNASNFTSKTLTSDTDGYSYTLTESQITDVGLEYFFYAEDATGNTASTDTVQIVIQYTGTSGPAIPNLGSGGKAEDWRMFSIPFVMDNKNVSAIFEAPLGTYDQTKWRIFHYENDAVGFKEYKNGLSVIERGKGYWFNSVKQATIPMSPGKAPRNTKDKPAIITVAQGWNQIGNPYVFDLDWSSIANHPDNAAAHTASHLRVFRGGTDLSDEFILRAFEGAYVFVNGETDINGDETGPYDLVIPMQESTGGRIQKHNDFEEGWLLNLNLAAGIFSNEVSGLGMHPDALLSKDRLDHMRSPRFEKYIDASFDHPEHFMPNFSRDIVPEQENYVWEFAVSSNVDEPNRLMLWNMPDLPENKTLTLVDQNNGNVVDMLKMNQYSYADDIDRKFKVIYGDRSYLLAQLGENNIQLGVNYPNPFTKATTIPFSVHGVGDKFKVRVNIYSINGNLIKTLVNKTISSGIYSIEWDGRGNTGNLQLGLLIYSLEVETSDGIKTIRKKMIRTSR